MTVWNIMDTPLRGLLIVPAMLLLLWSGYLCLMLLLAKGSRWQILPAVFTLCALAVLFFLLLDGAFHYAEPDYPRTWPAITDGFCALPVAVPVLLELLAAGYLLWTFWRLKKLREASPSPASVKETVDLLPAGIAFAREDGQTVFANLTMDTVSRAITGKVLSDLRPLLARTETAVEAGTPQAVVSARDRVWQLTPGRITEHGTPYLQLTATDVTDLARINDELRSQNRRLREIRRRLEIYSREADRIVASQELLNARMQVHNETGHVLLASRRCMEHPEDVDASALLQMLKTTNDRLLKEYEEDDDAKEDPLTAAIDTAKAIGVTCRLRGAIPEGGTPRTVLAAAIRECASNLRKHADGDLLQVTMEETGGTLRFTLCGNGAPPNRPVSVSGGLASLRTLAENAGGEMKIDAAPAFTVTIELPN